MGKVTKCASTVCSLIQNKALYTISARCLTPQQRLQKELDSKSASLEQLHSQQASMSIQLQELEEQHKALERQSTQQLQLTRASLSPQPSRLSGNGEMPGSLDSGGYLSGPL